MDTGTESRRRLRAPRASYGSGDVPRWRWRTKSVCDGRVGRLDNSWLPEFFSVKPERGEKRKAPVRSMVVGPERDEIWPLLVSSLRPHLVNIEWGCA